VSRNERARVLVVTGGGRGIGAATARLAAQAGYSVCVNYHSDRASAERLVDELKAVKAKALAVRADVAVEADILNLFRQVDTTLGRITALVNNAGIVDKGMRVELMTGARLSRMFAVNVTGTILCAREAVKRMSKRQGGAGGAIVNVSSIAAKLGAPGEYVDYAASKGAVDTFTVGLAKEVGVDGIRVNAVRPGIIRTEIHASSGDPGRLERIGATAPLGRPGEAEEVARTILWLLSDEASYLTGALVDVAGGR
jgi:NAD(P)-dependent dehydrogenase (short-subunit alcohol dehydrogenase family)